MKTSPLSISAVIFAAILGPFAASQAEGNPFLDEELPIPSAKFIPPPPPKEIPPMLVEATTVLKLPTHRITVLRGDASKLPDIPIPPLPKPTVPGPAGEPRYLISFGATVYDSRISHVKWWNPKTKIWFEAWCAWDWTLLAPIPDLEVVDGFSTFHLFAYNIDTTKEVRFGKYFKMPEHPELEAGTFVITMGNSEDPTAETLLTTLRDYHFKHKERLILIQNAREEYQAEAAAWYAANPPKPEYHTFWLKPHRGSRYLKNEGAGR